VNLQDEKMKPERQREGKGKIGGAEQLNPADQRAVIWITGGEGSQNEQTNFWSSKRGKKKEKQLEKGLRERKKTLNRATERHNKKQLNARKI